MTSIRQIIEDAYGETNIVALGDVPDADQFEYGLRRLNVLIESFFDNELGEPLIPVNYGTAGLANSYAQNIDKATIIASTYIPANSQLILNLNAGTTLYLPPNPADGARFGVIDNGDNLATYPVVIDGNGRQIEDADSVTLATDGMNRGWFYRRDLGNWVRVSDLVAEDVSPFPPAFDDFLVSLLAFRINGRFDAQTPAGTVEILKRMRRLFRAKYHQSREVASELGLYRLSDTSFMRYYWYQGDATSFNRGMY